MDTASAAIYGQMSRGREHKVFDWDEAARRIRAAGASSASAGLQDDWEWTGGDILADGKPIPREKTYVFLASTWATPELDIGNGPEECYRMRSDVPGWDAHTYWPQSAIDILSDKEAR